MQSKIKPLYNIPIKNIFNSTNNIEIEKYYLVDRTEEIKYIGLFFHNNNIYINKSDIKRPIYEINIQKLTEWENELKKSKKYFIIEDKTIFLNFEDNNNIEENNKIKNIKENPQNINNIPFFKNDVDTNISSDNNNNINELYLNNLESFYKKSFLYKDEKNCIKSFNSVKADYLNINKLFDIPLIIKDSTIYTPDIYKINDKYFAFVYPNDLDTYYITESGNLLDHKMNNNIKDINEGKNNFNEKLGLYFCGENLSIQIGKEIHQKKCAPNEFICKECMEINKKKYFINNDYLININGRIAKINEGKIHCFGHFLIKKQIEDCITKFTCKACQMLNSFLKYYEQ